MVRRLERQSLRVLRRIKKKFSVVMEVEVRNMRSFGKLYTQVLIGVALGIALGYAEPQLAIALKPYGDAFIKAIKLMVAPIVFTTVVVGIAAMGDIRRVASVGLKAIIYFEIMSTLALLVG